MVVNVERQLLEYLKIQDTTSTVSINTFRLSRELGIKRDKLLDIIKKLKEKGAVEFQNGVVRFIRFPEEKVVQQKKPVAKPIKIKKATKLRKKRKIRKQIKSPLIENLKTENKKLLEKLTEANETIKKLEKKASIAPKVIKKIVIKRIKVPVVKEVIKEVPVIKEVVKEIFKKEKKPQKRRRRKAIKKRKIEKRKIKAPKFKPARLKIGKGIKHIKKLKGIAKKITRWKPNISFKKFSKQLRIPKLMKKRGKRKK